MNWTKGFAIVWNRDKITALVEKIRNDDRVATVVQLS